MEKEAPPEDYAIQSSASHTDDRTRVLKHQDTFAVFDRHGDVLPGGRLGLFFGDTRHLSRLELKMGGARPLLLSSTVTRDNALLAVDLTNPDLAVNGEKKLERDTIYVFRAAFLDGATCHTRLRVHNFGAESASVSFVLHFSADFADIFEVRGMRRAKRGTLEKPVIDGATVKLSYLGLDGRPRTTRLVFDPPPDEVTPTSARWNVVLERAKEITLATTLFCEGGVAAEVTRTRRDEPDGDGGWASVMTANDQFNAWVSRSVSDLKMMVSHTPHGPYPYAGVPWYSVPFGRDGIITAFETLWMNPSIAAGVLRFLAANQAREHDPANDAEPGKILHEMRRGEMAVLKEVPFERYYGTIDATPLFVMLARAYAEHTGDLALIDGLWGSIEAALEWMARWGDQDGDGFLEYAAKTDRGLANQGWKDSVDSVFHADGRLAQPPIALCEVQAYAYSAWSAAAAMAAHLGKPGASRDFSHRADELARRFEEAFWLEEAGTYALALDAEKRPCQVRSSNAGHVLFSGIARPDRAARVADTLLAEESFSGWGVRTVSAREQRYNPMSYHNGSVWPHDNALIAAGLARYGHMHAAARILGGLFDASLFVDLHRLPELFCGFRRREGEGPTLYPVACSPQAWASGAVYMLLQACLGLRVEGRARRVSLVRPVLPGELRQVRVKNLAVGTSKVDLELVCHDADVGVNVTRRQGEVEVLVVK